MLADTLKHVLLTSTKSATVPRLIVICTTLPSYSSALLRFACAITCFFAQFQGSH